ncbi:MAG: spermidine synthase [Ectothiorhodospiraceae bacterium]|nr:spermidine synthase [Ectothiorhodospiraceae bacterium]
MRDLDFVELDYRETPIGAVSLRRRRDPRLGDEPVYEVTLDEAFLMSSRFTAGEVALARLGLAAVPGAAREVVIGGLGLGHTAAAALDVAGVAEVLVVELLGAVVGWHRDRLVPLGERLCADPRCRLVCGDFFALASRPADGFDHARPGRRFDAVLLDIDHSPSHRLDGASAGFYTDAGLRRLAAHLRPGGVFAMWSNDAPDADFASALGRVFTSVESHVVAFPNPYSGEDAHCTVYVASAGSRA